ncbi:MAG TPA: cytosolic protein, partial [Deltaproteobacteria bacterium]|nr:cytosolic protein [Deltaproteobacteria bacterium]
MQGKGEIISQIIDGLRLTLLHYGLWFKEVEYQLGLQSAMEMDRQTWQTVFPILMKRLGRILGFETDSAGTPKKLFEKSEEELREILTAVSINWLAADGVWFQSVERNFDMYTAKRCTDICWSRFSPLEAFHIKTLVGLPKRGGLEALE